MVALAQVIASNKRIKSTFSNGLVAVFVGGTSGVGEYTVKTLVKYAPNPRIYIVGRSQEAADRIIQECKDIRPGAYVDFIKADISLMHVVDNVCWQIKSKETSINLLFESQGSTGFSTTTSEGLNLSSGLAIHSRVRFLINLLPLIQNATSLRRVVSVGAASCEGNIDINNIPGTGFPLLKWRNQIASIGTLVLEHIASSAPDVSFIHDLPGIVRSGILRDREVSALGNAISWVMMQLMETPPDEVGERHLFLATSARYASSQDGPTLSGVPLNDGLITARGSNGKIGSGMYTVDNKGESSPPKVERLLAKFRADGTAQKVWDYVEADFKKITGTVKMT